MSKKYINDRIEWNQVMNLKNFLHLLIGTSLAVVAMKGFMIPNRFMDGGITGISILLHEIFHINISFLVIILTIYTISFFVYSFFKRTLEAYLLTPP